MEGLSPLHRRVAGIDVHRMLHGVTVLIEQPDGSMVKHSREFGPLVWIEARIQMHGSMLRNRSILEAACQFGEAFV